MKPSSAFSASRAPANGIAGAAIVSGVRAIQGTYWWAYATLYMNAPVVALTNEIESHRGWLCGADGCGADPGGPPAPPPEKTHWLDPIQLMAQTRLFLRIRVSTPAGDVVPFWAALARAQLRSGATWVPADKRNAMS